MSQREILFTTITQRKSDTISGYSTINSGKAESIHVRSTLSHPYTYLLTYTHAYSHSHTFTYKLSLSLTRSYTRSIFVPFPLFTCLFFVTSSILCSSFPASLSLSLPQSVPLSLSFAQSLVLKHFLCHKLSLSLFHSHTRKQSKQAPHSFIVIRRSDTRREIVFPIVVSCSSVHSVKPRTRQNKK